MRVFLRRCRVSSLLVFMLVVYSKIDQSENSIINLNLIVTPKSNSTIFHSSKMHNARCTMSLKCEYSNVEPNTYVSPNKNHSNFPVPILNATLWIINKSTTRMQMVPLILHSMPLNTFRTMKTYICLFVLSMHLWIIRHFTFSTQQDHLLFMAQVKCQM